MSRGRINWQGRHDLWPITFRQIASQSRVIVVDVSERGPRLDYEMDHLQDLTLSASCLFPVVRVRLIQLSIQSIAKAPRCRVSATASGDCADSRGIYARLLGTGSSRRESNRQG